MATYKEIKGVTIQTLDSDPVVRAAVWSSGGDLGTARATKGSSAGTQNASSVFGGQTAPGFTDIHEQYNGTSWTTATEMNTARYTNAGAGTYNASFAPIGVNPSTTRVNNNEAWNGSSWSESADVSTSRRGGGGTGASNTNAVIFGGAEFDSPPGSQSAKTEKYNGSSWTESGDLSTARSTSGSAGVTNTAALFFGPPSKTEQFDGTSWTEVSELNTERQFPGGAGPYTLALAIGGDQDPGITGITEEWNGSSWTEVGDLATARRQSFGSGTNESALATGGYTTTQVAATEEFSVPTAKNHLTEGDVFLSGTTSLKVFGKAAGSPAGAWSSQTNINTARGLGAGCGTQDSALIYGGFSSPPSVSYAQTEEWNGSTWTEKGDLNVPFYYVDSGGLGTVAAALAHGGEGPSGGTGGETFDGSSWSEISNSNSNHIKAGGAGSSTAGLSIASYPPTSPNEQVEEWNGSSWTEIADVNEGRGDGCGSGTSTSAWWCGGEAPGNSAKTEVWNGSTWTEVSDLNTARFSHRGSGANQNDGLVYGGSTGSLTAKTELWNGSTWTEISDLATARQNIQSSGGNASGSVSALASGGYGAGFNAVEEFVVDATLSTVTVS